ncbi:MAG: hypothetical protein K5891_00430 [Lachnospiraceae bacterium]|nr:hypothetical protein [Lachnospiraceae bacterium]
MKMMQDTKKDFSPRQAFLLVTGMFLLFCVIRYLMADFTKVVEIYPDELRDWDIARSLQAGNGFSIQGKHVSYQKNLYSILISPLFAVKDIYLRIRLINLFNVLTLCGGVFFLFGMCREWELSYRLTVFVSFLYLLWPNQLNSINFMCESIYVPMFMLGFWVYLMLERKGSLWLAVLCGVVCYLVYYIKERGIILPAVCVGIELAYPVFRFLFVREEGQKTPLFEKKRLINAGVILVVFLVLLVAVKLITYDNEPNEWWSSDLTDPKNMFASYHTIYGVYFFLYYLVGITLSVFCLPIFVPLILLKELEERVLRSYLFIMICNFLMAFMISFRIAQYEDYGKLTPRLHLRYFGPQIFLSLALFLVIYFRYKDQLLSEEKKKPFLIASLITLGIDLLIFKGMYRGSCVDHYDLHWLIPDLQNQLSSLRTAISSLYSVLVVMGGLILGGYYCIVKKKEKGIRAFFAVVILISILNNVSGYNEVVDWYDCSDQEADEIITISGMLRDLGADTGETSVLVMSYYEDLKPFVTYCDESPNYYLFDELLFWDQIGEKRLENPDREFVCSVDSLDFYRFPNKAIVDHLSSVDYFVVGTESDFQGFWEYTGMEKLYDGEYFILFRNLDPATISMSNPHLLKGNE